MPSQAALFHKYFLDKKSKFQSDKYKSLLLKYGGKEHLEVPQEIKEKLSDQIPLEDQFNPQGNAELSNKLHHKMKTSSYAEDVLEKGHKSIWGSYWHHHFGWGYACCLGFNKRVYCKGMEGKKDSLKKIVKC